MAFEGMFDGKVAVVTGSANGIGRGIALKLAGAGADVAILDIEDGPLSLVAGEIEQLGRKVVSIALDLTQQDQVEAAFAKIKQELGPVDVLVNNVGQTARERATAFHVSDPAIWDFVIGVSLKTTMLCSRQVVNDMRDRMSGKIVNIASDSALLGDEGIADYCAAKGGVIGFTRSLAREMGPFDVNVNAVCPGGTLTRGLERIFKSLGPAHEEKVKDANILKKFSTPEDIANSVAFLASDLAHTITGQILVVNSGRVLY